MMRSERTKFGAQCWHRCACEACWTHVNDYVARDLRFFVRRPLSGGARFDMLGRCWTFSLKKLQFWEIWSMPEVVDEIHRVMFVNDGSGFASSAVKE